MPMTDAKRQQKRRSAIKADPTKHAEYKLQERQRWKRRVTEKRVKQIGDLAARSQRCKRKKWKKSQQEHRERSRMARSAVTPPQTPEHDGNDNQEVISAADNSRQKHAGRKMSRRSDKKAYRTISVLQAKLHKMEKRCAKYRKRLQRSTVLQSAKETPRSKTRRLLRGVSASSELRRTMLFHHTFVAGVRERYKQMASTKKRKLCAFAVCTKILKKYQMTRMCSQATGIPYRKLRLQAKSYEMPLQWKVRTSVGERLKQSVSEYFERDDNSRETAGKKETVTRNKDKKQKRILLDSMKILHDKYLAENPGSKLSYTLFTQLRPFWVCRPTLRDRETCLCKTHANLFFLTERLIQLKLLAREQTYMEKLCLSTTCDPQSKDCCYLTCSQCCQKNVSVNESECQNDDEIWWWSWQRIDEEKKNKHAELVKFKVVRKLKVRGTVQELLRQFHMQMRLFRKHVYNIRHQYDIQRQLHQRAFEDSSNECFLHIDFAENWLGGYGSEIQSVHFGGSHSQVTLHTGVLYMHSESIPLCTVSDCSRHDPPAIWAYLTPVLQYIRDQAPDVTAIHFQSDGPSTQYRQKTNLFFFATKTFDFGFHWSSWNFSEAGHGKGAPDGVGGVIKRTADAQLARGHDVPDAKTLYDILQDGGTSIKLFYVPESSVSAMDAVVPSTLATIPGTMKIHQVITSHRLNLMYRDVGCCCKPDLSCDCFQPKSYTFATVMDEEVHVSDSSELADPESPAQIASVHSSTITDNESTRTSISVKSFYENKAGRSLNHIRRSVLADITTTSSDAEAVTVPMPSPSFEPALVAAVDDRRRRTRKTPLKLLD